MAMTGKACSSVHHFFCAGSTDVYHGFRASSEEHVAKAEFLAVDGCSQGSGDSASMGCGGTHDTEAAPGCKSGG